MSLLIGTHNGSFHADDVLAVALIRAFVDADARVMRTRDLELLKTADVVVDVGTEFEPARCRFDHHQQSYTGPRSSAGMVLDWLQETDKVPALFAARLRDQVMDYVDAVDNGRRTPDHGVPCLSAALGQIGELAVDKADFDQWFEKSAAFAELYVRSMFAAHEKGEKAKAVVAEVMADAEREGRAVLFFAEHVKWKRAYFEMGGETHPTDFALMPDDDRWRIVAIPPEHHSMDKKRPLPIEWAGLRDDELSEAAGVPGGVFCHKNLFMAIFKTRDAALNALKKWGLYERT